MSQQKSTEHDADTEKKLSFWQMMLSVFQASFGVQNQKNKERDFEKGSIKGFIAAALIFTVLFVLTIVTIVSIVLP
ncbi:MAG: DUF2970 domain-containing protein [Pseudohongiella sp.]|nr:DUF2970 domain-containing protein [Pseudohongiella sp.]MDO9519771.1 DUF2970 domain-containing protein [Pseudohongiella sp.]MDP2126263.1 DUF2970 domain-containing protein [Pseudohongiella sp.]